MKAIVARLLITSSPAAFRPSPASPLAAEVPRLAPPAPPPPPQLGGPQPAPAPGAEPERRGAEMADALAEAVERLRQRAQESGAANPEAPSTQIKAVPHKHSMSWIRRWRIRRKQRRAG
jgi:hypothetical protein